MAEDEKTGLPGRAARYIAMVASAGWRGIRRLVRVWPMVLVVGWLVLRFIGESVPLVACAHFVPWVVWWLPLIPLAAGWV